MVLHSQNCLFFHPRDLSHPMGGFFSAEDADSKPEPTSDHKKEGAFCVWTHDELQNLLQKETFKGKSIHYSELFLTNSKKKKVFL